MMGIPCQLEFSSVRIDTRNSPNRNELQPCSRIVEFRNAENAVNLNNAKESRTVHACKSFGSNSLVDW